MVESDIEEYTIDTKEGKNHFTLRVSLYDNRVRLLITTAERPNKKYYNLVKLSQLQEACNAFEKVKTIKDALIILKNNIESGNILISEDNIDVIDVKFVLKINGKNYSPFVIGLPIDNDSENEEPKKNSNIKNTSEKKEENNNIEVLPTKFDYQGNKEAELRYGQTTKSTTEYVKPIIQSDVKEPNLVLEVIEPILQVHYPDGTTKSTALPARLQTADGKEPDIAPEQLKSIHEQIYRNFNININEIEKEKNRNNSVSRKNPSSDFSRQTFNPQKSINNLNAINNLTPNLKNFQNKEIDNNSNDINAVRSALKPNINMNINMNMNTMNNYNIRQVKTQFNPFDNTDERKTTGGINNNIHNININMPLSPRDNYIKMYKNKLMNKNLSEYSISSVPNRLLVSQNLPSYNNYNLTPNTSTKNSQISSDSPLIQEVPILADRYQNNNLINSYNNIIMMQKGLSKSSSSPSFQPLGKVNHNFYQQNQNQNQNNYFFRQNNYNNYNNYNSLAPQRQNLQNQINNVNLQFNNNKINSTHTSFMNFTHNPNLVKNNQNYTFNNTPSNALSRNLSNQNTFTSFRAINPLIQSSDEIRYQQLMNQRRLQEQQRFQLLQRTKMNNLNYNSLNNISTNNTNVINMNYNDVSRNPNLSYNVQISSKSPQEMNYAEVNILEKQIGAKPQVRNIQGQNIQNMQKMQNLQNAQNMQNAQSVQNIQNVQNMQNIQNMQNVQNVQNIQNMQNIQKMQNMQKMQNIQSMQNIQNMQNIQKMQHMNNYRNKNNLNNANINNNLKIIDLNSNMKMNQSSLKQSHSQQVIRQTPSMKNEITNQQIAWAQKASLENQKNPNNFNANIVSLQQKFLDSSGNEETQSQFERESNKPHQIRDANLKIENENISQKTWSKENNTQIIEDKKNPSLPTLSTSQTPLSSTPSKIMESSQQEEEIVEDPEAEKLFRLENGNIIFRNGLLRGIIHKYYEIDEIVSKIQLKLMAGAKFMLIYRASTDGDKAKIFHQKCDKHNMTLVLVETTKGVRFGGFTTKTWDGNCLKKIDNEAFVFSFDKRKSYDVMKNEYAIGAYPKFGPVFFGCQIRIYDEFFTKGGTTCNRGLNYKTKEDYELNNGEQRYIVKEIEVYNIESIEV